MYRRIQNFFLLLYRSVVATGLLSTGAGRTGFEAVYMGYKAVFEAGPIGRLHDYIRPDSLVIDVGANIGFFTVRFGRWVPGSGRVVAIEPEARNVERLAARIERSGIAGRVEVVQAVAADIDGTLALRLNPHHPGDHRIGPDGVETWAVRLDTLLEERGWPPVSLIKIDVQGAEERVLDGAAGLLARARPALFVEVHDVALRDFGSSAAALLSRLSDAGYKLHLLRRDGVTDALSVAQALEHLGDADNYLDFLCLPAAR